MDNKQEQVNHPKHYNRYSVEAVDMAIKIWGKDAVQKCSEITAFFYRMRLGLKDDINQDLAKEEWWLNKAKELAKQYNTDNVVDKDKIDIDNTYKIKSISGIKITNPEFKFNK